MSGVHHPSYAPFKLLHAVFAAVNCEPVEAYVCLCRHTDHSRGLAGILLVSIGGLQEDAVFGLRVALHLHNNLVFGVFLFGAAETSEC